MTKSNLGQVVLAFSGIHKHIDILGITPQHTRHYIYRPAVVVAQHAGPDQRFHVYFTCVLLHMLCSCNIIMFSYCHV